MQGPPGPQGEPGPQGVPSPQGKTGPQGAAGKGIRNIRKTAGSGAPGTKDTYTITLTDGSAYTFEVYNGANGNNDEVKRLEVAAAQSASEAEARKAVRNLRRVPGPQGIQGPYSDYYKAAKKTT